MTTDRVAVRGSTVATDGRNGTDATRQDVPLLRSGRRGAFKANAVVVAYVEARCRAGLSTEPRMRAILGRRAKTLISAGGWEPATLIEAAERFAATRRHVSFFAEWVATVFNAQTAAEHAARKADELEPAALDLSGILKRVSA